MKRYEQPTFESAEISEILPRTAAFQQQGWCFVQICAITREDSCDVLYSFADPTYEAEGMAGFVVNVPDGTPVPSITGIFPAAFVFENETHDLFGVNIEGISIDFGGDFYQVAVAYPMNPRMAVAGEEANNG